MRRHILLLGTLVIVLAATGCVPGAAEAGGKPSRATSVGSVLGWFAAIDAHNRQKLLCYVAPSDYKQMGWATHKSWSKFTDVRCKRVTVPAAFLPQPKDVDVRCTFHESASATEGNPDTLWDVYLHHTGHGWLIDSYGQG
jgi:hypothetical protein